MTLFNRSLALLGIATLLLQACIEETKDAAEETADNAMADAEANAEAAGEAIDSADAAADAAAEDAASGDYALDCPGDPRCPVE